MAIDWDRQVPQRAIQWQYPQHWSIVTPTSIDSDTIDQMRDQDGQALE